MHLFHINVLFSFYSAIWLLSRKSALKLREDHGQATSPHHLTLQPVPKTLCLAMSRAETVCQVDERNFWSAGLLLTQHLECFDCFSNRSPSSSNDTVDVETNSILQAMIITSMSHSTIIPQNSMCCAATFAALSMHDNFWIFSKHVYIQHINSRDYQREKA